MDNDLANDIKYATPEITAEIFNDARIERMINEYNAIKILYSSAIREVRTKFEILDEEFSTIYKYNPIHNIDSRLKTPRSMVSKLIKNHCELNIDGIRNYLTDIAGVRVICNYIDDVQRIANLILKQDDIKLIKMKNYIANPKANGYRSLHLVITVPIFLAEKTEVVPVEVQIRTIAMDFWASLEHNLKYKSDNSVTERLSGRLKKCAESINTIDHEMQRIHDELNLKD